MINIESTVYGEALILIVENHQRQHGLWFALLKMKVALEYLISLLRMKVSCSRISTSFLTRLPYHGLG
jgi:hypothetical protein